MASRVDISPMLESHRFAKILMWLQVELGQLPGEVFNGPGWIIVSESNPPRHIVEFEDDVKAVEFKLLFS